MRLEQTDVMVVGGGLVGLSMAAFLGYHGVRPVLVERHDGIPTHPRARGTNPRTMELLRMIGLEERVRASESARALAHNSGVIAVESLAGREIGELRHSYHADSGADYSALSPTGWCLCHQDELEPLLRERAGELGADLRFATELVDFTDDGDGVLAAVRDVGTGARSCIAAKYLVAADGAHSAIRQRLGIPMRGQGVLARFVNIQFRADLREPLGERRFIICYTTQAGSRCALLPIDNAHRWLLHVVDADTAAFDEARCVALIRAAAGVPDLDVQVDSVLPWDAADGVAERFAEGRVFLAGDAAHVMPPSGAFGSNTGIQDAHNLAWKLAAGLAGTTTPALLDTYDEERRPAATATVRQAVLRSKDRPRLVHQVSGPPDPEILPDPVVIFNYRYPSAAAGRDGGWLDELDGSVGSRAPHVRLAADGRQLSTTDLFGREFVLLTSATDDDWHRVAADAAGAPLVGYRIAGPDAELGPAVPDAAPLLREIGGRWAAAYGVGPSGAVLVRPDGIVCWRAAGAPDPGSVADLRTATDQLIGVPDRTAAV